jgi:hypothetical protein
MKESVHDYFGATSEATMDISIPTFTQKYRRPFQRRPINYERHMPSSISACRLTSLRRRFACVTTAATSNAGSLIDCSCDTWSETQQWDSCHCRYEVRVMDLRETCLSG